ncbi:MAG TPA: sterol desaturase family protein [Thiolinea sp.]|nr:sterol desaturase family protein [Thiolinea sp.]
MENLMQVLTDGIVQHETLIRLGAFLGLLILMALWQAVMPRRPPTVDGPARYRRWCSNLLLVVLSTLLVRILLPFSASALALLVETHNAALLGFSLPVLVSVLVLDLLIYLQHRLFHTVPLLWRLHKVHHSDHWLDVSTALRFHPLEILLSMLIKFAAIWLFGIPALAVILFEVILNGMALFNHANIRLPLERWWRQVVVTPDMHRIHHSVHRVEHDSNYGFNLSGWDRLFGTYVAEPVDGQLQMRIGIPEYRAGEVAVLPLLFMPFRRRRKRMS